jgi:hypothetical protein
MPILIKKDTWAKIEEELVIGLKSLQFCGFFVKLDLFTISAVFLKAKFAFAFGIHINFVAVGYVILIFTDRTD